MQLPLEYFTIARDIIGLIAVCLYVGTGLIQVYHNHTNKHQGNSGLVWLTFTMATFTASPLAVGILLPDIL
jgi:hypothetical protein